MDIVYNHQRRTLSVTQTVTYRNRSNIAKSEVKFHIFANAFREGAQFPPVSQNEIATAFPNGKSFGHIDIGRTAVDGASILPQIGGEDENLLIVPLPTPLAPNATTTIDIFYTVHLANIAHRLGYTDRVVNLGNFYPVPVMFDSEWLPNTYSYNGDPFFNALHNFDVTITKPRDMVMASSGVVIRETKTSTTRTTTIQSRAIRDWAAVLSPHLQSMTRFVGRTAVHYYFLDDADPIRSLEVAVRSLETFSRLFVRFPYRVMTVVQTDFLHGGMEFGEIVFIAANITNREDIDRVIIHEMAHQWWYGIIGNDQVRTAWIDEGLAEYSTLLFFDENPDLFMGTRRDYINMFRSNLASFTRLVRGIGAPLDKNMNRHLNEFNSQYEYVYMAYVRGMLLFADLEMMIGREYMVRSLAHFARAQMFGIATQKNLLESFEQVTTFSLGLFFESYLLGLGVSH